MILSSLHIRHFRNIEEASIDFEPGVNLFHGPNAQGKTNLIEAIHFLATSVSHRARREEELIQWGTGTAYLRGVARSPDGGFQIECGIEKGRKAIKLDGRPLPRVGDLYGLLRVALFAPEDLELISGGPQNRRRFIDMAIAQQDPSHIPLLQAFRKALTQRNAVLKRLRDRGVRQPGAELAVWDRAYLDLAAQTAVKRLAALRSLAPLVEEFYGGLAGDGPLTVSYSMAAEPDEAAARAMLRDKLEKSLRLEIERGSTLHGPHRDDLRFFLRGKDLCLYGSQGQRRSAALVLRLAEARWRRELTGAPPLLLIDDVVYEMDNTRRSRFWDLLDLSGQAVVTATDPAHLGIHIRPAAAHKVTHGQIHPDGL